MDRAATGLGTRVLAAGAPEAPSDRDIRVRSRRMRWPPLLALGLAAALWLSPPADASAAANAAQVVRSDHSGSLIPRQLVVRRALRADTSQHYLLYVPARGGEAAALFVSAHGISRNAEEHATLFAPFAEQRGVVLVAPIFDPAGHEDYQRLGRKGHSQRADVALDVILDEVRTLPRRRRRGRASCFAA